MKESRLRELFYECMEEIYQNSIPKASFKELRETSPRDPSGRILIPYESYKIPDKILDDIVEYYIKTYKIRGYQKESFKTSIYLGPSPVGIR